MRKLSLVLYLEILTPVEIQHKMMNSREVSTKEYAPFYSQYIKALGEVDLIEVLESSLKDLIAALEHLSEEKLMYSYAEGKWTIKELLQQELGKNLTLTVGSNIKFTGMIIPTQHPAFNVEVKYTTTENQYVVDAQLFFENTIFTKFKGTFTSLYNRHTFITK